VNNKVPVYFVFSTSRKMSDFGTMRNLFRIARRHPRILWANWLGELTQMITGHKEAHVSVAYNQAVFNLTTFGAGYWPWMQFWMQYPCITGYVRIWTETPPDLEKYQYIVNINVPAWKSILKFYTFGIIKMHNDCADVARDVLMQIGIETPVQCNSPGGLKKFLINKGYEYVELAYPSASDCKPND